MNDPAGVNELENSVLELLENEQAAAADWIAVLEKACQAGAPEAMREWAALAQDALAKRRDLDEGMELLKWRADNTPPAQMTGKDWVKAAERVVGSHPHQAVLVPEAGFGQPLAARECVRRLRLLLNLNPGALCLHRTWGFGVVRRVDSLYKKIEIDFRGRPGHGLAMKVAGETLELLNHDHLLARWHQDRDALQRQVNTAPGEVVRLALASFGPLAAGALQARLMESGIVPENDWKRFWDAARKALKADPLVAIPARRGEPIRLLDRAGGHDDAWFNRLANERQIKTILEQVRDLVDSAAGAEMPPPAHRAILANRLAFVLLGATSRQPGLKLMAAMLAARLGLEPADCDWPAAVREFQEDGAIVPLLHDLPARELKPALEFLWAQDATATRTALLGQLRHLHFNPLQEALDLLLRNGAGEDCRRVFAEACATHLIREEGLLWLLRHPDQRESWDLPLPAALAPLVLEELEQDYMGDRLKTRKMLREEFEKPEWLRAVFDGLTPGRQQDFFRRLNQSPAWPGLDRQVLQAQILKLYPHLQAVITGSAEDAPAATYGTVTSHRSYRERREKLDKLINVEIPANSREIAVARSYGDLSENFEYKAAKDMQRVLLARRADLEEMIGRVRPTDFSEAPKGVAGVGATVTLAYPDGSSAHYHILGEWDQEPDLHIISSNTRLAKAVAGKRPGDKVLVPTDDGGEVECTLRAIEELPDEIKEWVK
ncbi:MAG: GreA/GreB family elongation factor [Kiritimatiellae bacterium]|nr:GreA/GreB family elongation factor [Kiritimatiellia bacterium]